MQYRRLYQNRSVQFTWGSLHILFLGGLTYLYCLWCSRSVRESARQADIINTCMACSTVLTIIAERWNLASSYREMFEILSQRTISMTCSDSAADMILPSAAAGFPETGDIEPLNAITRSDFNSVQPQDFIVGLDEIPIPQESEWLIEELIRSVNEPSTFHMFDMGQ